MPRLPAPLRGALNQRGRALLARAGHSELQVAEARRVASAWVEARLSGVERRTARLWGGSGVVWTEPGRAELVPCEVAGPGPGEVTLELLATAVSPGTERARYLRLPNAAVVFPHRPGNSGAGRVLAVGSAVEGLAVGDRVAAAAVPHASVATISARYVHPVPAGVSIADAATVYLGIICRQGIDKAGPIAGRPLVVVGAGLIGALAQRIGVAEGAGPVTVLAASRRREAAALAGGADRFLVAGQDGDAIAALAAPVVVEASGHPDGVALAIAAAGPGGRVVLLGSTRGVSRLPVGELRRKGLTLVGAHVNTVDMAAPGAPAPQREVAGRYLAALADPGVRVDDLLQGVDPREAGLFYRTLGAGEDIVGARMDWEVLPPRQRLRRTRAWSPPDVRGLGVDHLRRPVAPPRRRPPSPLDVPDPLAGATGMLRFGLLGCGDIAVRNAAAIAAAPNARLVACFDPVAALADELAQAHGAQTATTAEQLVGRPDIDAVFLAVPHHLHAPLAMQAMDAGCHVVVEKPPAESLDAALRMAERAEATGIALSICFPQRYEAGALAARRLVEAGAMGEFAGSFAAYYEDKPPSYWTGGFSGRSRSDWRSSKERSGGGVLIMNLSHYIDLVRHLGGVEAESVAAVASSLDAPEGEVEDVVSVSVRYANGAVGTLLGRSSSRGTRGTELRLWGRDGAIAVEPEGRVYTLRAIPGLRASRWNGLGEQAPIASRTAFVSRFASAVTEGRTPDVSAADGLAVQAFIEAAYRSAETGEAVRPAELVTARVTA